MKKIIMFVMIFCTALCFFASGCQNKDTLDKYVSELRSNLYVGQSENYSLKAGYGFKETPFLNDGKVGELVHGLSFKLINRETDQATFTLSFSYGEQTFKTDFKLNPVTDTVTAFVEIENFNADEFTVSISSSSNTESIVMHSTLPDKTISYSEALSFLKNNQYELIKNYMTTDGELNAELYVRIIVKDNNPYWYVGIANGNDMLKALLVDGFNGEILAIREIL